MSASSARPAHNPELLETRSSIGPLSPHEVMQLAEAISDGKSQAPIERWRERTSLRQGCTVPDVRPEST